MPRTALRPVRIIAALFTTGVMVVTAGVVTVSTAAHGALPSTSTPDLRLDHTMMTSPFVGSSVSMKDNEGTAYVPRDGSLWLADDNGRAVYEVNPSTGALKRTITRSALADVRQLGGGAVAGSDRSRDIEALAYDASSDVLYVFSGPCCTSTVLPTVFRLTRQDGTLRLDSYQPLANVSDFTGAAWNPGDGRVYVGAGRDLRSYSYQSNTVGAAFRVPDLTGILGLTFSADGTDLFVARTNRLVSRVDWATRSLVAGWTFGLSAFGMIDTRAVELIGDQFWVSDGYDYRAAGDPLSHAVFVFDVVGATAAPTAAFTATPTSGTAPLTVSFTDTSTGGPTSWRWEFGDGNTSTAQNPSHVYADPGVYTAQLTASNSNGSSTTTRQVTVDSTPPPSAENLVGNPGFESSTDGWNTGGYSAVSLERVSGGRSGSWSAKLTNTGTTSVTNTLNDNPNWVGTSQPGTYTGSLWVRSNIAGGKLYLRVREFQGSTKVSERLVPVVLSTSWQQVTATLVPTAPGSSTIDFSAAVYSAPAGSVFYADDASLTRS